MTLRAVPTLTTTGNMACPCTSECCARSSEIVTPRSVTDIYFGHSQRYLTDFVTQSLDTSNDVTSVVSRYRERLVHYLFGLADFGEGDQRCEALAQGDYHLMRGRNFMRHLRKMDGGFPEAQTVNYIPKIQHDPLGMFTSRPGLEKLFAINFDGGESPVAVGDADPDRQVSLLSVSSDLLGRSS